MTIKEFCEKLKKLSKGLPDGVNSKIRIGHTWGENNTVFGDLFYMQDDDDLIVVDSYYHYFVKFEADKLYESDKFFTLEEAVNYTKSLSTPDFTIWRVQNGMPEVVDI